MRVGRNQLRKQVQHVAEAATKRTPLVMPSVAVDSEGDRRLGRCVGGRDGGSRDKIGILAASPSQCVS